MKVFERNRTLRAYRFLATEDGTNLKELEEDVKADGGVVIPKNRDYVQIKVFGKTFGLAVGFYLVLHEGRSHAYKAADFYKHFVNYEDSDTVKLRKLTTQVDNLEKLVQGMRPTDSSGGDKQADVVVEAVSDTGVGNRGGGKPRGKSK